MDSMVPRAVASADCTTHVKWSERDGDARVRLAPKRCGMRIGSREVGMLRSHSRLPVVFERAKRGAWAGTAVPAAVVIALFDGKMEGCKIRALDETGVHLPSV